MKLTTGLAAEMLQSPKTCMTAVGVILESTLDPRDLYGEEGLDVIVVVQELMRQFSIPDVHPAVRNRLQAILTLRGSDLYETTVEGFVAITLACVDGQLGDLVTGQLETPDMEEAVWGLFEAAVLDPDLQDLDADVSAFLLGLEDNEDIDLFDEKLNNWMTQLAGLGVPREAIDALMARGLSAIRMQDA